MRLDIKNSTSHADVPVHEMYEAIGVQLFHLCRAWPGANHVVDDLEAQGFYLELVDALPEAPGALGYHDIDADGIPYSKIGVDLSLDNGSDWLTGPYSVVSVIGHEALETVCDPIINIWRDATPTMEVCQEVGDPVQDTQYRRRGCDLTNFVLPSYFNPFGKAPFDYLGVLDAPFTITSGGYLIVRTDGRISQKFGETTPSWRLNGPRARTFGFVN